MRAMSATLHTNHGDIKLELFCDTVPRTCFNWLALAASGGRETKRTTDDDDDDDDDDDAQLAAGPLDVLNPGPFALAGAPGRPGRLFVDLALPDPDFVFGDLGVRGSAARRRAAAAS